MTKWALETELPLSPHNMAFHMQGSNTLVTKTCTDDAWAQPAVAVKRGLQSPELSIWQFPALHSQEKFKKYACYLCTISATSVCPTSLALQAVEH